MKKHRKWVWNKFLSLQKSMMCHCYIYREMSSLLVVVSRSWSRPRIFIIIISNRKSYGGSTLWTHRHTHWKERKIIEKNLCEWVNEGDTKREEEREKNLILTTTYILSFIRSSLFTLIPLLSHSFIQLLHICSSTKISIHLRMDDAA
jgi:hypothetical protein